MTPQEFRDSVKAMSLLDAPKEACRALFESLDERRKDFVSFLLNANQFKKLPKKERLIAFFNFLIRQSTDLEQRFDFAV